MRAPGPHISGTTLLYGPQAHTKRILCEAQYSLLSVRAGGPNTNITHVSYGWCAPH